MTETKYIQPRDLTEEQILVRAYFLASIQTRTLLEYRLARREERLLKFVKLSVGTGLIADAIVLVGIAEKALRELDKADVYLEDDNTSSNVLVHSDTTVQDTL